MPEQRTKIPIEEYNEKIITEKVSSIGEEREKRIKNERELRDLDTFNIDEKKEKFFGFSVYAFDKKMEAAENKKPFPEIIKLKEILDKRLETFQTKLLELAKNIPATDKLFLLGNKLSLWFKDGILHEKNPEKFIYENFGLDYTDEKSKEYINSEIEMETMFDEKLTEETREKMRKKIIADEVSEICAMKYINAARNKNTNNLLSNDNLLKIIKNNIEIWQEKEIELKEEVKIMKEKFLHEIKKKIDAGQLPITMDYVKKIADSTEFSIVDPINSRLREVYGDYFADTHTVRLATNVPIKLRYSVFVHEMMHALSGKSELISYYENIPKQEETKNIRVGTRLKSNFVWLNEALTEQATLDTVNKKEGEEKENYVYLQERKVLDYLINTLKIPRELFYEAYFENYDLKKEGHKQPHLKELFDYTNKNFGNGFLINLDKFIRGSDKNLGKKEKPDFDWDSVFKDIEKEGENFPKFVNEFFYKPIA